MANIDYQLFLNEFDLDNDYMETAQKWFIPLGDSIALHHKSAKGTLYIGVNGAQGSGKSTLSAFLSFHLTQKYSLRCIVMSLDDFYLSQSERIALSVKVHPLLKTRGVPGTHNTELLNNTLNRLHDYGTVSIPSFDKSTDNPRSVNEWSVIHSPVDIVIVEGWCWGVSAQSSEALVSPVNALEEQLDPMGIWRQYVNNKISAYQTSYDMMNYWVMLAAPSFDCVKQWRMEQEQRLQQALERKGKLDGKYMSASEISEFVMYFQRLTEHGLSTLPEKVDCLFQLDERRSIADAQANFL